MTTQLPNVTRAKASADDLQQQIRVRIDSLSYLPTTAAVAMKFVELGKQPDAEPADYARIVSADSSLSSKLLALANSSWAGVRNKVTTVKMAVNLLGLGTVRTLAISYCMTGLHNELRLSAEESEALWESSLCKAVAAKTYAGLFDEKLADEAFVGGLFQDFALAVMCSIVKEPYLELLRDAQTDVSDQLQKERALFGMDHAEVGRALAQKLELPELFVDMVAFHHDHERLSEFIEPEALRDATYAAGLLPHALNAWNGADADALAVFLQGHAPSTDAVSYVTDVQAEFVKLYTFFHEGDAPSTQLTELLEQTAREVADHTTELVGTVNTLLQEAATTGARISDRFKELEGRAERDQLTGVLNRQGFTSEAQRMLAQAARYGTGVALAYLDIDKFKAVNDSLGHAFGDLVLQRAVAAATAALPLDALLGRMGGDEFVLICSECTAQEAQEMVAQVISSVAAEPVREGDQSMQTSLSAGLIYVRPSNQVQPLDALIKAADKLMYAAKGAGGNQMRFRTV